MIYLLVQGEVRYFIFVLKATAPLALATLMGEEARPGPTAGIGITVRLYERSR